MFFRYCYQQWGHARGMEPKEIQPNIFLLEFEDQVSLMTAFCRFQEHYESPHFRGKIFSLEEFKVWYTKTKDDVIIENYVWIGHNVTILSGVKIGSGACIGAHSLVTKDVEPYTIVGGNPAKVIKKRFSDDVIVKLLKLRWWDWEMSKIKKNMHLLFNDNLETFLEQNK